MMTNPHVRLIEIAYKYLILGIVGTGPVNLLKLRSLQDNIIYEKEIHLRNVYV